MGLEGGGGVRVVPVAEATGLRDFERLAELLRLDAVGVADTAGDDLVIRWWGTPGTALPGSIRNLLTGEIRGWIVADLPGGAIAFAKLTGRSSAATPAVLQAVAPLLIQPPEEPVPQPGAESHEALALQTAMTSLRDDLGFETASLFARGSQGWELLARQGPVRPWHAVLDPGALEGTAETAEYADARTIPGVGSRLAGLGCASVAMVPVPPGARLILDSSTPRPTGGWIDRARPFLTLVSILSGPEWSGGGALRTYHELGVLRSVFAVVQRRLREPAGSIGELLPEVRDALGATELFLLSERTTDVEVVPALAGPWPGRLPVDLRAAFAPTGAPTLPDDAVRSLSMALGLGSAAVLAAFGREEDGAEVLLAGWGDGLALSPVSMSVVARAVSAARAALESRQRAVSSLMDDERTRIAYALHDGLVQAVASAVLELEALRRRFELNPEQALSTLNDSKAEIRRSLADLRSMLFDLSRERGTDNDPSEPITRYVQDVARQWRLAASVTVTGDIAAVPGRALGAAYAVIREGVANAAKHAGSGPVAVRLAASDGELWVSISDAGRGFTAKDELDARRENHFGLEMLRQRVQEAGGRLVVDSRPGTGTQVEARLPTKEGER